MDDRETRARGQTTEMSISRTEMSSVVCPYRGQTTETRARGQTTKLSKQTHNNITLCPEDRAGKLTEDVKTAEDSEDVFTQESPEDVKAAEDVKKKMADIETAHN